jgi:hypothetical protein
VDAAGGYKRWETGSGVVPALGEMMKIVLSGPAFGHAREYVDVTVHHTPVPRNVPGAIFNIA